MENVTVVGKAIKYKSNLKVAVVPSYLTAYFLVCFPPDCLILFMRRGPYLDSHSADMDDLFFAFYLKTNHMSA